MGIVHSNSYCQANLIQKWSLRVIIVIVTAIVINVNNVSHGQNVNDIDFDGGDASMKMKFMVSMHAMTDTFYLKSSSSSSS